MGYSVRAGFAVVNDETLEVEEYHDTQEEALAHQMKLTAAETNPTGVEAAEVAEMRKRRKKVRPALPRPKAGQYNEPTFVPHLPDTGVLSDVAFVPLTSEQ